MFCAVCGVLNSTARSRCRDCGSALRPPAPRAAAPRPAAPPPAAPPPATAPPPRPPTISRKATVPLEAETSCADCGARNPATRSRCRDCGMPLRPSAPRPAPPPAGTAPPIRPVRTATDTFCTACGVLNSGSRSRCRECGASLRAAAPGPAGIPDADVYGVELGDDEVVCRGCHRISPADEEWCAGCGRRLRLPRPVAPPPAPGPVRICPRCRRGNPEDAEVCFDCGGRFPGSAAKPKPETAPAASEPVAAVPHCPACGTPMEAGEAGLGMNYRRLVTWFTGSSWLELFFRRGGKEPVEWVMRPDTPLPAARCTRCGGLWIAPRSASAP